MPASSLATYTFQMRQDDFSVQVSCDQDPKFWFRLEQGQGEDIITDFFLGGFDPALGGDLLNMCYKKISRSQRLTSCSATFFRPDRRSGCRQH